MSLHPMNCFFFVGIRLGNNFLPTHPMLHHHSTLIIKRRGENESEKKEMIVQVRNKNIRRYDKIYRRRNSIYQERSRWIKRTNMKRRDRERGTEREREREGLISDEIRVVA